MARDDRGRFAPKPVDELSPAYARRLERNLARGKTRSEARGHGITPRRQWETSTVAASPASGPRYWKALEVLALTRRGESLTAASRMVGIATDTVLRYVGSAYERDQRGRWAPKPNDRFYRRMRFIDTRGEVWIDVASAKEASKLSRYWNAVDVFAETGVDRGLRPFRHATLRTRQKARLPFVTDPRLLERLGYAHHLAFENIYQQ